MSSKTDAIISSIMNKYKSGYKPEIIRVKVSCSFPARARCKKCGDGPSWYYYHRNPHTTKDIKNYKAESKFWRAWIKRLAYNWYLEGEPRWYTAMEDFKFRTNDIHYRPTLHRARGSSSTASGNNITELLSCNCGLTVWAFNDKSTKNRPEITNRKGRSYYPHKFIY